MSSAAAAGLRLDGALHRGRHEVAPAFEVPAGAVVALVGPNGSGKSTTLRAIAGLMRLERGSLRLGEELLDDAGGSRFVPPSRRGIGLVFQDHLLFPHLSVRANVAFGAPDTEAVDHALGALDIGELADRRPSSLSGGQAQRVAVARALAARPRALLLDEPFAALDASARVEVRAALRHALDAFEGPVVLVSHDPVDAYVCAEHWVVLTDGRVTQQGAAAEISARPRGEFLAWFAGMNVLRGRAETRDGEGDAVVTVGSARLHVATSTPIHAATAAAAMRVEVFAAFPPHAVTLSADRPRSSARNAWRLRVSAVEPLSGIRRVRLTGELALTADVTAGAAETLSLRPGVAVWASVKATAIEVYSD